MHVFPEVVHIFLPFFEQTRATRKASVLRGTSLTLNRHHFDEETFWDAVFVPLVEQTGQVGGLYNTAHDITRQKLTDRRSQMLSLISVPSIELTSTSVYPHIAACLDTNPHDFPFAILYRVENEFVNGNEELTLRASVGLSQPDRLPSQPMSLHDDAGFLPFLRAARHHVVTTPFNENIGDIDWKHIKWRGHGQQPQHFSTLPIRSSGQLHGFVVVGSNPRQPIDDDYDRFMSDLQRHITTAVVASASAEESLMRSARLEARLAERERQIRYMAQHADICMMQLDPNGTLIWANERYHTVVNHDDDTKSRQTFIPENQLIADDRPSATKAWAQVLQGQRPDTTELRLQHKYTPPIGSSIPSTILLSSFPYMELGEVKFVMACMTDVSQLKWAESWQAQLAYDAKEAKRQQSEFTDAISHEIRNPLSAILQLADGITRATDGLREPTVQDCMTRLNESIEAAQTIVSCASHQKRIVDDVLTLSKMDLGAVVLSPIPTWPGDLVHDTLRILQAEATANAITLHVTEDHSLKRHVPHQVMCDSLRVTQVLINLISNAIKFTKQESRRVVTIKSGATLSNPHQAFPPQVVWASQQTDALEDRTEAEEWGSGSPVYLTFAVEDTGPGMLPEEMSRIFNRFQQASARTSVQYGGSGLGLFISHSLVEKHGGRIGAYSTLRLGSTFVFYIMTRLVTRPPERLSNGIFGVDNSDHDAKMDVDTAGPSWPLRTNVVKNDRSPKGMRSYNFLLVEDNIINQQILRKQLVKAGSTVYVANHGIEALTFLRSSSLWTSNKGQGPHVDIVLMDWEMPVMDGLTCTREIRSMERSGSFTCHVEVIAVTANVRPEQVSKAKEAGVDALVPKPFTTTQLLEVIMQRLNE